MALTERQRGDLHTAMLEYLLGRDEFAEAATVFQRLAGIETPPPPATPGRGLLERKWTSVVRLQKKVLDLEAKLTQAEQDLKNGVKPLPDGGRAGGACSLSSRAETSAIHAPYVTLPPPRRLRGVDIRSVRRASTSTRSCPIGVGGPSQPGDVCRLTPCLWDCGLRQ
jgi:hypothetical protein